MTTTVLNQPRTLTAATSRAPLLQRIWRGLAAMGASRAAEELRRQSAIRAHANPAMRRQMLAAAENIERGV